MRLCLLYELIELIKMHDSERTLITRMLILSFLSLSEEQESTLPSVHQLHTRELHGNEDSDSTAGQIVKYSHSHYRNRDQFTVCGIFFNNSKLGELLIY